MSCKENNTYRYKDHIPDNVPSGNLMLCRILKGIRPVFTQIDTYVSMYHFPKLTKLYVNEAAHS